MYTTFLIKVFVAKICFPSFPQGFCGSIEPYLLGKEKKSPSPPSPKKGKELPARTKNTV